MGHFGQAHAISSHPGETVEDRLVIGLEGSQSIQVRALGNADLLHEDINVIGQGLAGCSGGLDLGRGELMDPKGLNHPPP